MTTTLEATTAQRETVADFIARKHNPAWRPAALPRSAALPRMTDQAFEQLYRQHMADYGRPVADEADIFATLPRRGGIPFTVNRAAKGAKLYPIAESASGNLVVVKHRPGRHDVYHYPSGLMVATALRAAGTSLTIGTARDGDGWRTKAHAEQYMRALDAAEILDDNPKGIDGRESVRAALQEFITTYRP